MAMKFSRRRSGGGAMKLVGGILSLVMAFYIGGTILGSITPSIGAINTTNNPFYSALTFIGLSGNAAPGSGWTSTAIVGVLGLAAVAAFIMGYFKVAFK